MTARFRHRHDARAELVSVSVQPGDGRISETYCTSESELRRFAWALLADLAPDDVPETPQAVAERYDAIYAASSVCQCGRSLSPRAPNGKAGALLRELGRGPLSARDLADCIDRSPSIAAAFLTGLSRCGLVERTNAGGRFIPAIYRITAAGRAALLAVAA